MTKNNIEELEDLELIIEEDIRNNFPSELDCLSTHTYIDSVDNITIESEEIENNVAILTGEGTINLELQYNSDRDYLNGDGLRYNQSFTFMFHIKIDIETNKLLESNYEYNLDKFYS